MLIAYTRDVSPALANCELSHLTRVAIDFERARAEHAAYEQALLTLGVELRRLPPAPELPDAVFVEDTAIVLDELAIITLPGAASRRPETQSVADVLALHRPLAHIAAPGTLDGGDVLVSGRALYVGRSLRSNDAGIDQLRAAVAPHGYFVVAVEFRGCLHLKSAATRIDDGLLLANPDWVDPALFGGHGCIAVDPSEPHAANALAIGGNLIHPAQHPRTRARLEAAGLRVLPIELVELAKAEAGVTCCSLLVDDRAPGT